MAPLKREGWNRGSRSSLGRAKGKAGIEGEGAKGASSVECFNKLEAAGTDICVFIRMTRPWA